MTTPTVTYAVQGELTSPRFARAFATGCGGPVVTDLSALQPGNFASFCTPPVWPLLHQARHEGRTWWYGDHGFFRRGTYFRVARNAYTYQYTGATNADPERFAQFGLTMRPWRRSGRHIVICPQSEHYMRVHGLASSSWTDDVMRLLRLHTDRPCVVRHKRDRRPIAMTLRNAWALVTFSSAAAHDALLAGVPVFVLAPFATAFHMGTPDLARIESPVYPDDRESFFHALASHQWTLTEMASGRAMREQECP